MITSNYIEFFKELQINNSRDWFHDNKKRYEQDVKRPFLNLIAHIIPELQKLNPKISNNPNDALFRINRDIRFSKDKTPYHTLMKAGFSSEGKKSRLPGFYLGIGAEHIHIGGGVFQVSSNDLKKIRTLITENTQEFIDIINSRYFVMTFKTLLGEKHKRIDKKFHEAVKKNPYILNKQFYAMNVQDITSFSEQKKILNLISNSFHYIDPLNKFLDKAY